MEEEKDHLNEDYKISTKKLWKKEKEKCDKLKVAIEYVHKLTYRFVCQSDKLTRFYTGFSYVTQLQGFMDILIDSGLKDQCSSQCKKKITFEDVTNFLVLGCQRVDIFGLDCK
eukprot:Pgem_evm1s4523